VLLQSRWDEPEAAWEILKKGPEALASQFCAGYGMALNLLHTRTMQQAREFVDASFASYLGGYHPMCRGPRQTDLVNEFVDASFASYLGG
jgi:hypothetical protein